MLTQNNIWNLGVKSKFVHKRLQCNPTSFLGGSVYSLYIYYEIDNPLI